MLFGEFESTGRFFFYFSYFSFHKTSISEHILTIFNTMAETLRTFQSQLSGVMETVFKAAIFEITRLVEDSFVEEVIRCREQVESLERRLKAAEIRRKETPDVGKERCADCGRACPSGDKDTRTEKSLKQESVLPEEAQSSQDAAGEATREETEEANPNANSSTKTAQVFGGYEDKTFRLLKEEPVQSVAEGSDPQSWTIGADETDASDLHGPSKHFSEQNTKSQVNWEPGFDQIPESSQDGHSGDSSEPPVQNRFSINDLGGFDKTGPGDNRAIDMGNFDDLQDSKSHMAADLSYVDQYEEDVEAPEGAEHHCYPTNSPQNRRAEESSVARSPLKANCNGSGELSCLFIDEEGYLQDLNVRYADQESGDSGSRRSFYGQDVRVNPSLDSTENMYGPSETYSNTLHLGNRLQHQTADSGGGSHILNQCFPSLPDSIALKTFKQIHKSTGLGSPYSSNQCAKAFPQACNPKVHSRIHSGQGLHFCSHCGKGFSSFTNLKAHKCGQTGDKPYCCPVCGNKFSRLWNLKLHQRIHTQEKPHRCGMCDKSFTRADILKVHQRTHTGERPYCCSICGLSFKRLDHLKSHQRKHVTSL